jgi:hypothetical protein
MALPSECFLSIEAWHAGGRWLPLLLKEQAVQTDLLVHPALTRTPFMPLYPPHANADQTRPAQ